MFWIFVHRAGRMAPTRLHDRRVFLEVAAASCGHTHLPLSFAQEMGSIRTIHMYVCMYVYIYMHPFQ